MSTVGSAAPKAAATEPAGAACSANWVTSSRRCCESAATAPPPCPAAMRAVPRDRSDHPCRLRARPPPRRAEGDHRPPTRPRRKRRRMVTPAHLPPPARPHWRGPRNDLRGRRQRPPRPLPIPHARRAEAGADRKRRRTTLPGGPTADSAHRHLPGPHSHGTRPLRHLLIPEQKPSFSPWHINLDVTNASNGIDQFGLSRQYPMLSSI